MESQVASVGVVCLIMTMDFPAGVIVRLCWVIMGGGTRNEGALSLDATEEEEAALRLLLPSSLSRTMLAAFD